jgi:hypothetical protein
VAVHGCPAAARPGAPVRPRNPAHVGKPITFLVVRSVADDVATWKVAFFPRTLCCRQGPRCHSLGRRDPKRHGRSLLIGRFGRGFGDHSKARTSILSTFHEWRTAWDATNRQLHAWPTCNPLRATEGMIFVPMLLALEQANRGGQDEVARTCRVLPASCAERLQHRGGVRRRRVCRR